MQLLKKTRSSNIFGIVDKNDCHLSAVCIVLDDLLFKFGLVFEMP